MIIKSIRGRTLLWLAFLLVGLLAGFGVTAYQLHRTNWQHQLDEELSRRLAALSQDVRSRFMAPPEPFDPRSGPPPRRGGGKGGEPPGGPRDWFGSREIKLLPATAALFADSGPEDFYFAVWSREGRLIKQSFNLPPDLLPPSAWSGDGGTHVRMSRSHREAYQFTEIGECVLAGRSIAQDRQSLHRFALGLAGIGAAVLALGLGGGWLLITRALRPVGAISTAASRIAAGNLAERINAADTDSELGRLAQVLNATFARLEKAFDQQKQFTADASHELRTPIAVLVTEAQSALARERTPEEYRETVSTCLGAAQQMRQLTQSLLELARFDAGQVVLDRQPVDLAECVRAGVDFIQPLARERDIRIQCDLRACETEGDAERLYRAILNLLTNAINYNKSPGEIRVSAGAANQTAVLTISDTGQGIAPEHLPHVFERFYRGEKSRSSGGNRTGLGLAIVKAIVEAHGGSINISSQLGVGTICEMRLPAKA